MNKQINSLRRLHALEFSQEPMALVAQLDIAKPHIYNWRAQGHKWLLKMNASSRAQKACA